MRRLVACSLVAGLALVPAGALAQRRAGPGPAGRIQPAEPRASGQLGQPGSDRPAQYGQPGTRYGPAEQPWAEDLAPRDRYGERVPGGPGRWDRYGPGADGPPGAGPAIRRGGPGVDDPVDGSWSLSEDSGW